MTTLNYNGATLNSDALVQKAVDLNVPPSFLITLLHYEALWGTSNVAKTDNNWAGITWSGEATRPSGIVVSKGSKRPANEGGYYNRYKNVADFLTDWIYLFRKGGIYKVADSTTFEDAVKGMFKVGGAKYDYATMNVDNSLQRYQLYLQGMVGRRQAINRANDGALDKLDNKGSVNVVNVQSVLNEARKWLGVTKYSVKHKQIVDGYNSVSPRPAGYAVTYNDDWCDTFVTFVADRAGASNLIGRECGVERHKNIFKQKGIWLGLVRPQPGDIVTFHWGGARNGFAHHIGFVESVDGNTITTIEGNTTQGGASIVGRNKFLWNNAYIQGYARPKYGQSNTPAPAPKKKEQVKKHLVASIDDLRVFKTERADANNIYETLKKGHVRNITQLVDDGTYLWAGYAPNPNGYVRWTTVQTSDGKRVFAELKDGHLDHKGLTIDQLELADKQPVDGDEVKLKDNEILIDGVVYEVVKKEQN
ncbi:CHAP domain-containing protein [Dolosicoccus paucivorans]|uniref:CHAP domain-containing protein n=1 Tax=Dolosicoccus paucivorans TaxID=84521 RepID=UPI0008851FB2|nr:CHAP domain-containing protein [Dolosicoccus paucivorans]SDI41535.1 CHAP domain-containing protein [Dolosicoccus paucivorans]